MTRSLKKGPYIDPKLLKKIQNVRRGSGEIIKTWSRATTITPEMIGYAFGVHNGRIFVEVRVSEERRPPLEASYRALGAELVSRRGCLLPERFSDTAEECRAVRTSAGVIDRTDRAYLTATGADAVRFLHGMVSNEVKELEPGQGRYALQLTVQGQIIADLYLLAMADHLLLETDWALKDRLRETLEKYVIADEVELADHSDQLAAVAVEGPRTTWTAIGEWVQGSDGSRRPLNHRGSIDSG